MEPITDVSPEVMEQLAQPVSSELPEDENPEELAQELKDALEEILNLCELEDLGVYEAFLMKIKRLVFYFNNIVDLFWDEVAGEWREPNWEDLDEDTDLPPRVVAVYRAHAEAIIAALSVTVPSTIFFPDDADNPDDIDTAETYSIIAELIQKHVKAPLLFMRILTILFNQGTVYAYNYYRQDKRFGYYNKPKTKKLTQESYEVACPQCDYSLGESDVPVEQPVMCQGCGQEIMPSNELKVEEYEFDDGMERIPKGRVLIDMFGPVNVKASFYARNQEGVGYIRLKFDQNVGLLRDVFSNIADKIEAKNTDDRFDNWARLSPNYQGAAPMNTAIVKCLWLRPWMFWMLGKDKEDIINALKDKFPNGCYAIFINDIFADAVDEDMDDHWTVTDNPLSDTIYGEPLGTNLATLQDIRAEIDELELQTMEHGIPETFFDQPLIDTDKYKDTRSKPGMYTPVNKQPGESLGNAIMQTKPAVLSEEIEIIKAHKDQDMQFVTGSFPSVYGGPDQNSGGTASEYTQSKQQALQRLGITWRIAAEFWSKTIHKGTVEFHQNMETDERLVVRKGNAFQNLHVRLDKLQGKIGSVEPEFADQLPLSWAQIKTTVVELLTMGNEQINAALFHPQNSELMKKAVGLVHLYIPGEEDRKKQYREFQELINGEPMMTGQIDPMTGQPILQPSVMPDEEDDDAVHIAICKSFLVSSTGMNLKREFPAQYQNIVLHMKAHEMKVQMQMMQQMQQSQTAEPNAGETAQPQVGS